MPLVKWFFGGLAGGAIGGLIWVLVGYYMNAEVGYIAWGIGGLAGLGVRVVAGEENDGAFPGAIAVLCAILSILISKYLVIALLVPGISLDMNANEITNDEMIGRHAESIIEELESRGKTVKLPPVAEDEETAIKDFYPPTIWKQATKEWKSLNADQQAAERKQAKEDFEALIAQFGGIEEEIQNEAFLNSFSPFDLLWLGLAAFTAFKIGGGIE